MNDHPEHENSPDWLRPIEDLANEQLGDGHGSACDQVHPIVARWFEELMQGDPPPSRDAVQQAVSCLATEVYYSTPEEVSEALENALDEEDVLLWVEQILLIGRAFEGALRSGELDDL